MQDELDRDLQALFLERSRTVPEEPFLSNMLGTIKRQQLRRNFMQAIIPFLGFVCCAVLSPLLIRGALQLSNYIGTIHDTAAGFLDSPTVIWAGALSCILLLWLFRRRLYVLSYRASLFF